MGDLLHGFPWQLPNTRALLDPKTTLLMGDVKESDLKVEGVKEKAQKRKSGAKEER